MIEANVKNDIRVDLIGPKGLLIHIDMNAEQDRVRAFIQGSKRPWHWLHHIIPFAGKRERDAGRELAGIMEGSGVSHVELHGHSLGGAVAMATAQYIKNDGIDVSCTTYGTKQPPWWIGSEGRHYRTRGDIVPFVIPIRKRLETTVIGERRWFWHSHGPDAYRDAGAWYS